MRLRYKTSGKSKPERKPRVYFSCHPDDFEAAFPLITEDILSNGYCVIWYDEEFADLVHEPEEGPVDDELPQPEEAGDDELPDLTPEEAIKEMRLVVFAVTSKFLHEKNRAKDLELPLALENHIPVLPIMLENGLGGEFSNTCAKIQVVSKYVADPTATPYEEVLKTYLDSVLVGKELAERVKTAFDAYVFLSYRKKDREHAKRLIHLIHEKKEFRDIAIWFDEYLVPGERFNDAIRDAFEKSSLFAMAVTPHLTEDGNYVMRVEYPLARDREEENAQKEKNDFAIVPVELYTDKEKVGDKDWRIDTSLLKDHEEFKYKEIPDLKNEHRKEELDETLLAALERIAKKANDGSAEHKFFIGLAYLNRIDVETDQELALELITEAAKDPEMLEAGATGYFETRWLTKDGVPLSFTVYNPGDAPAAFADCVIIGTSNEEPVTFSNGVKLGGGHQETLDEIIAILGEPFQITGEEKEDSFNGQYLWRDESGDHILSMTVRIDGDHLEISMPVYMNYAVTKQ